VRVIWPPVAPRADRTSPSRYLAPVVVALLALATIGAFAYAQRLKREPLILDKVSFGTRETRGAFTPNRDCVNDHGRIRFRITRSDRANVEIVDPDGRLVRMLARDRFLKRYRFFVFHWNGRTDAGRPAPPGRYKLELVLLGEDRELTPGGGLRLHKARRDPTGCRRKEATGGLRAGTA
jgi:hypothetical protein